MIYLDFLENLHVFFDKNNNDKFLIFQKLKPRLFTNCLEFVILVIVSTLEKLHLIKFFSIRVFLRRHWWFTGQQGKWGDSPLFNSATSTCSQTFRHLFATLHVSIYHVFLIASLVFTRLLLDEIYRLTELPFDWLIMQC